MVEHAMEKNKVGQEVGEGFKKGVVMLNKAVRKASLRNWHQSKGLKRRGNESGPHIGEDQARQGEAKVQRPRKGAGMVCSCTGRAVVSWRSRE